MAAATTGTANAITTPKDTSTFNCPSPKAIKEACDSLGNIPLRCMSPSTSKNDCNTIQCNQDYINNYSICQCRHIDPTTELFEKSLDMQLLIQRCGVEELTNPFGDPFSSNTIQDTTSPSSFDKASLNTDTGADAGVVDTTIASNNPKDESTAKATAITTEADDDTSAENDSYNSSSTFSVGAIVAIVIGFGLFLLAATLVVMILGSKYKQSTSSNGPSTASSSGTSVVYEMAPPAEMSSIGHQNSPVIWDKIDRDFEMNGALPVYSDIMADGSPFSPTANSGLAPEYHRYESNSDQNSSNNNHSNVLDRNSRNNDRAA
ncbi:hypothetical protein BGZ76_005197 [Entomortierella beljakovae]|nr:hypothetical protein BGZ76_005197 [Entomortierella beljakovae]